MMLDHNAVYLCHQHNEQHWVMPSVLDGQRRRCWYAWQPEVQSKVDLLSAAAEATVKAEHLLNIAGFYLSRVSILLLTRDIDIVILSVRLFVRDTLVLYENGLTYRHSFSTIR